MGNRHASPGPIWPERRTAPAKCRTASPSSRRAGTASRKRLGSWFICVPGFPAAFCIIIPVYIPMEFQQRLQKAIERGQKASVARIQAERDRVLTEKELQRLHAQYRLELSERIERCA